MRAFARAGLIMVLGLAACWTEASGDAGDPGAVGDVPAAGDENTVSHGVYTLTGVTENPPSALSGEGYEITLDQAGSVELRFFHAIGGNPGEWKAAFTWSSPPAQIVPGETWPITAQAKVLVNSNPLGWAGSVEGRIAGASIFPLADNGGSKVIVRDSDAAGTTVSEAATGICPEGGADFDLSLAAANGNKAWTAEYAYHYKWIP
jgi:hypothetical protein